MTERTTERPEVPITWVRGHDEHTWYCDIGDVYRLRVFPGIGPFNTIHYHAQVCNATLTELATELRLPTVEVAKQRAIYLTWQHCFNVGDALLVAV